MVEKLLAAAVFLVCAAVVSWYALVHTVHLGTRAIPDLRGHSVEEAQQLAHDAGLDIAVTQPGVYSDDLPVGVVAVQEPHPGFHVKTGSTVEVKVSMGAARATVPDLRGDSLQGAVRRLEQAGLAVGRRAEVRGQAPADTVIASSPPAGSQMAPDGTVDLLVNATPSRPEWVMPSFLNLRVEQVQDWTRRVHLRLGQVQRVDYPGIGPGAVLRQYPAAGSPLAPSDIITVWVSQ